MNVVPDDVHDECKAKLARLERALREKLDELIAWADRRCSDETKHRPDVNIYKRTLVETWGQVQRKLRQERAALAREEAQPAKPLIEDHMFVPSRNMIHGCQFRLPSRALCNKSPEDHVFRITRAPWDGPAAPPSPPTAPEPEPKR